MSELHTDRPEKPSCPRCGSTAATRVHRTSIERVFKLWRIGWKKMECDVCYASFWKRAALHADTAKDPVPE